MNDCLRLCMRAVYAAPPVRADVLSLVRADLTERGTSAVILHTAVCLCSCMWCYAFGRFNNNSCVYPCTLGWAQMKMGFLMQVAALTYR